MSRVLRVAAIAAATAHRTGSPIDEVEFRLSVARVLERNWRRAMIDAGDELARATDTLMGKSDLFRQTVEQWVRRNSLRKVVTISRTFFSQVRSVIDTALLDGKSQDETARMIRKVVGGRYAKWMAQRVARTEMAAAVNLGSDAAARGTGLDMVKEWAAVEGPRTRPSHSRANGQTVEMDEHFVVGDSLLMQPGDPNGPAKEIINCRCVALYNPRIGGEIIR